MRLSLLTIGGGVCLLLLGAQPAFAQRSGVPAMGYYRPCIMAPQIERATIIQPEIQKPQILRPEIAAAQILRPDMVHPTMVPTEFEKPNMIRPTYLDPCVDGTFAFNAALLKSSKALGMKFDAQGHVVNNGIDPAAAAMLPPKVAAEVLARKPDADVAVSNGKENLLKQVRSTPGDEPKAPTVNTSCCGEVQAKRQSDGIRVRARQY